MSQKNQKPISLLKQIQRLGIKTNQLAIRAGYTPQGMRKFFHEDRLSSEHVENLVQAVQRIRKELEIWSSELEDRFS